MTNRQTYPAYSEERLDECVESLYKLSDAADHLSAVGADDSVELGAIGEALDSLQERLKAVAFQAKDGVGVLTVRAYYESQ